MSEPQHHQHLEMMRWYTRALRIPRLIGKLPSGERIKGGPYRLSQAVVAGGIVAVGAVTMSWWGPLLSGAGPSFFVNWGTLLGVAAAAGYAIRYMPSSTVSPLLLVSGSARLAMRPGARAPRWAGRALDPGGPARVRARWLVAGCAAGTASLGVLHAVGAGTPGRVEHAEWSGPAEGGVGCDVGLQASPARRPAAPSDAGAGGGVGSPREKLAGLLATRSMG